MNPAFSCQATCFQGWSIRGDSEPSLPAQATAVRREERGWGRPDSLCITQEFPTCSMSKTGLGWSRKSADRDSAGDPCGSYSVLWGQGPPSLINTTCQAWAGRSSF